MAAKRRAELKNGETADGSRVDFEALVESSDDPVWSVGLDFGILSINRAARQILRSVLGCEAPQGARPADVVPPAEAALWNGFYERALVEGTVRVEHRTPSGSTYEMTFNRMEAGGKAVGISGFGKEISGRKVTERALVEAEKKYHNIFDGALEGMFQSCRDGRILTANTAAARMLGYDSVEEILRSIGSLGRDLWVEAAERERYLEEVDRCGSVRGLECRFRRRDGSVVWVALHARKVEGEGERPEYLEGFIEDIMGRKETEKRLLDSEERYRATFAQAAVGILHTSFEGRILRCNGRFGEIVGYSPEEVRGMTFEQLTALEDRAQSLEAMRRQIAGATGVARFEKRYIRRDGSLTWVALTTSVQRDGQGKPLHFIAVAEDINARKQAEALLAGAQAALQASEERYRTTFQMSLDAININRSSDGLYVECNKAFLDITGYAREEVMGRTSLELNIWADARDRECLVEALHRKSVCRNMEVRFTKKSGETFWGLISASLIELEGMRCILSVTRDISDAKAAEEEIRTLAFYDPLTRLPNRRRLLERLRQATACGSRTGKRRALLFIDLDDFKTVNDTVGHQTGDLLLQAAAGRMTRCIRKSDAVARLGGDEFVVMLDDLDGSGEEAARQARAVAEKILAALGEPYLLAGYECLCTASIGITLFGDGQESSSQILKQADIAMYQAKAAGRNTLRFFAPALQETVNARAQLENELRQGIRANEFVLWYQPQVCGGRMVGAEALVRWNHPRRAILPPDEFIPLAEETGHIVALGNWVLEAACAQLARWGERPETAHLLLAVNISALQLRQPDFVEQVLTALTRSGAHAENLRLELTESVLAQNIEDIVGKMEELKSWGLRFALDDFGIGYSSLAYLKRLPLDQLKIDRMFVRDLLKDPTSRAIAQSVIFLSHAMGVGVIAEGVESDEQRFLLERLGCHAFQGYLFSRPVPLEEFEGLLPGWGAAWGEERAGGSLRETMSPFRPEASACGQEVS
ncbi:MAG TPA: EAL domain-containing protein [Acidobacteriaceae bacterium]|jgi:diguanylate cyclase (GGDEF)-like protein/PAS domain S-box-containing protein|nr:EAL domain-containing protein [Acidobacteriaceae bacterium]